MRVVILRGITGSGKSHFITDNFNVGDHIVSADDFFENRATLAGKSYKDVFDPTQLYDAHAACLKNFLGLLVGDPDEAPISEEDLEKHNEKVIIVDNTNCSAVEMAPYVALAQAYGAYVEIIYIWCDPITAFERNQHGSPFSVALGQFKAAERAELPPWWPQQKIRLSQPA